MSAYPYAEQNLAIFISAYPYAEQNLAIFSSAYPYAEQNLAIFISAYPYAKQNLTIFISAYPYAGRKMIVRGPTDLKSSRFLAVNPAALRKILLFSRNNNKQKETATKGG